MALFYSSHPGLLMLLPLFLPRVAEAKVQTSIISMSGPKRRNHWKYLSKFGYGVGTGIYKVRLKLHSNRKMDAEAKVQLEVFQDDDWPQVEAVEDVCQRHKFSKQKSSITIHAGGEWSAWSEGVVDQADLPKIWYFALSDCEPDVGLANFTIHRVKFEFKVEQEDGSEFSIEMRWMLCANVVFLLGSSLFVCCFFKQTQAYYKSARNVHPVIITLTVAVGLQYLAQILYTAHLVLYRRDGSGMKVLEVLSEIFSMANQVMLTTLLILIALGYTLLQSRLGELDLLVPLCFLIGVIHILLVGLGKVKDDASYVYHQNEGVIGWLLLVMRLLLYAWFLWAVQSSANEGGRAMRAFLGKYRAGGSIFFLSYPMLFMVTKCFRPSLQHPIMAIGLMGLQAGSNLWLASLFLTRGEYFQVSTLSASELPGGTKVGVIKEE